MKQILVVDDEHGSRASLKAVFSGQYGVSLATCASEAMDILSREKIDLVLLDVIMPDKDGVAVLKEIQNLYPDMPVIMVSASTSVRPVVESIRRGAFDYVTKPFDVEELQLMARRAIESSTLQRRVQTLQAEVSREFPVEGIVGRSPRFVQALEDVRKAAATDATVLICGESGTGKELAARLLHALSRRHEEPFVPVHCAALPESLLESELFGHEKGAFTSADRQKPGRFDLAGSGTLFFDEVSEMSMTTQVKLLRVLQEREFMRVGGTRVIRTDARIVAASAKDLREEAARQKFREDLYYRLGVVPVRLPSLRERADDVPLLCHHFLSYFRQNLEVDTEDFAPEAMDLMCRYNWPGNVRELRNIVERMLVLHGRNRLILADHLPDEFHAADGAGEETEDDVGNSLHDAVSAREKQLILKALREAGGVQTRAAEILGTTRRKLKYRMEKLNIAAGAAEEA